MAVIFVTAFYAYLIAGGLFALWFVISGVNRIDAGMHGAPKAVRLLIFPGSVLLWPVLLIKYLRQR